MKIGMACDHAGIELKEEIKIYLQNEGHEVIDFETNHEESCDLPDYVYPASVAVSEGQVERKILVDGLGYGSAMIVNKLPGIFANCLPRSFCTSLARSHSNPNVICLDGKFIS